MTTRRPHRSQVAPSLGSGHPSVSGPPPGRPPPVPSPRRWWGAGGGKIPPSSGGRGAGTDLGAPPDPGHSRNRSGRDLRAAGACRGGRPGQALARGAGAAVGPPRPAPEHRAPHPPRAWPARGALRLPCQLLREAGGGRAGSRGGRLPGGAPGRSGGAGPRAPARPRRRDPRFTWSG